MYTIITKLQHPRIIKSRKRLHQNPSKEKTYILLKQKHNLNGKIRQTYYTDNQSLKKPYIEKVKLL